MKASGKEVVTRKYTHLMAAKVPTVIGRFVMKSVV